MQLVGLNFDFVILDGVFLISHRTEQTRQLLPEHIRTNEIKSSWRLNEVELVSPVARDGVIFRVNFDTEESQRRNTNVAISFLALNQFVCPVLWLPFSSFL